VIGDNLRLGAATNAVRIASRWYESHDSGLSVGNRELVKPSGDAKS